MPNFRFILAFLLANATAHAQPLVDIIQVRYTHALPNNNAEATSPQYSLRLDDNQVSLLPGLLLTKNICVT